jgi:hypothetical protein
MHVERGRIERVRVHGLTAVGENGIVVYAHAPGVIHDVSLEGVSLTIRSGRHSQSKAGHLDLRNTEVASGIVQRPGSGLIAVNVDSLRLREVDVRYGSPFPLHFASGPQLENIGDLEIDAWTERST